MDSYAQIFISVEMMFILIVMILAVKMNKDIGTFGEIRHFWNIQITFVVEALAEIIWMLQNYKAVRLTVFLAWVVNGISVSCFSLLLYEWFRFIMARIRKMERSRLLSIAVRTQTIVVIVDILVTITSFQTGLVYRIDPALGYSRGPFYWFHAILCYSQWVWTTILLLYYLKRRGFTERKQIRNMLIISMFPFFGGLLQLVDYRVPYLDGSVMLGTLLIFIDLQEEQITTDALTGLNNRAHFLRVYERMRMIVDI